MKTFKSLLIIFCQFMACVAFYGLNVREGLQWLILSLIIAFTINNKKED